MAFELQERGRHTMNFVLTTTSSHSSWLTESLNRVEGGPASPGRFDAAVTGLGVIPRVPR